MTNEAKQGCVMTATRLCMILFAISPAEPSVDLDLEYIENVFTYLER